MKKIAILGAMEIEIQPILQKLEKYETVEYANNKYYVANYNGIELVVAYSKIGKVFSSLTATIMIEHFGVDALLFTGVAGGLQDLQVGDMIAATATVQHDVDITAFGYPSGKIPISEVEIATSARILEQAKVIAKELNLNLHTGVIATGDQFVHSAERKDFVVKEFDAKAIEMEGASVNLICNEMNIPSFILRSISDTADGDAPDNFDEFAKMAANRSADFVMKLVDRIK
ncbi:5'-methylthioadenosine/adenosylhomocysteine nucleosidase [Francisella philomiragia]|uniref:5'-methylthioadenosine/adenosylhomocysteine nucleosidase n=1 Tax=Francisella philomiragia TaxID=28110 RepID=UPI001908C9F6|nr:5'-methylthioadenosine/adenosylhomocysteine nucleosidase [Francisella philomiragia]MBK2256533.1 5'-methylthioadenosine/adenosylhomocysteine nucleosidase [Francisella philomiragia]MBK2269191.1 5'-methylthioadenosine/adenosylhomocysteine nucleosidase [Francisella philomiragia]MBK2270335.1 5'-methylthioadenosine/adenosylhomocysteine nucleosidase [Francisella philomiragia]MBK2274114.1 5'-methylthioadenosine/adenosylhomocysteine nucleosidase [Francisella philomiragia]MBK2293708.1 5'-methylthioad